MVNIVVIHSIVLCYCKIEAFSLDCGGRPLSDAGCRLLCYGGSLGTRSVRQRDDPPVVDVFVMVFVICIYVGMVLFSCY